MNLTINNKYQNINFQKTLVANAYVGDSDNQTPVGIYRFTNTEDYKTLCNASMSSNWKGNYYLDLKHILGEFPYWHKIVDYYAMLNQKGELLSYCEIDETSPNKILIDYIETAPKLSRYTEGRKFRYIGQTLMAFIAKLAKKQKKGIFILRVDDREKTIDFYQKCGFKYTQTDIKKEGNASLDYNELDSVINSNYKLTGHSIDMIS